MQLGFTAYYIATKSLSAHATPQQMQQFAISKPVFAIGSMVLWYALLFIFLYLTLTLFYRSPFWLSLGWRKLNPQNTKAPAQPWLYLALGCALSIVVMLVTALAKAPEHAPIQDILKYDGVRLSRIVITGPGYPVALTAGQSGAGARDAPGVVTFAPDIDIPSSLQFSVAVERQVMVLDRGERSASRAKRIQVSHSC